MAEAERWVWLGGSLLLAVAASQASWWLWRWERGRARLAPFVRSTFFPPLLQVVRLLFYVGLPFAALIWGRDAVVGRLLGLQPPPSLFAGPSPSSSPAANWADWARDTAWAAGLGLAAWAVLAAGWQTVRSVIGEPAPVDSDVSHWVLLREAAFHEIHWTFYRNGPVVALGAYWGTWIGLILVMLEAAVNPWWLADLRDPGRAPAALVRAGLAVLSGILYLKTTNLWLAIPVHWGVTWGLAAVLRCR